RPPAPIPAPVEPVAAAPAPAPVPVARPAEPATAPAPAPAPAPSPVPAPAIPASERGPDAAPAHLDAEHPAEESAVTSADLAAAARRVDDPREQEVIEGFLSIAPRRREAAYASAASPTATATLPAAAAPSGSAPPDPYVDESTGLDSRAAWERALAEENARYVRYRRPVGIVVAELDGFARFEGGFGADAARRIVTAVGGAMRRGARRTDHVAHVGGGRFLVLLPETDEIQAINYVERIRGECDRWLDAGAVALRLSMGWASPSAVGELDTAVRTAEERMYAERRRSARAGTADPDASR
ncbi:MAG TPA: GGDEF domain-containing protein, partial [Patescibacteria group bacterium]|nr:GGDEF domain-containing protein [Patescibacteria group bacterium]